MGLKRIGIECESIESEQSWGVGRIVKKLLEEIAHRPELANEFKFFLYFKSKIPDYPWLANPIFIKKTVLGHSQILKNLRMNSFSLYYYVCLPVKLWFEKLDLMFFPNYMLPIIFRGKSLVMLTEDIYYEINSGTLPWRYKLAYRIFAGWWAAKYATKIVAISETSKHGLTKLFGIKPERIAVNQLGVEAQGTTFNFHDDSAATSKQVGRTLDENSVSNKIQNSKFQIPNFYILYVGQAFPRRHLREIMLAFEKLARAALAFPTQGPPLRLIAIGYDKYNPPIIKKLAEEINRRLGREGIIYREYVSEEELSAFYAGAKCVVYVSSKEAFGLPPLEGLAYGTVPVVADEPINYEIYQGNAFLVKNPFTPESIAETIKEALTNETKRREIIQSAPEILKKYTWQKHTDRFLKIIRQL